MMRTAITIAIGLAPWIASAQTATFIGNCGFRIQLGDRVIYSDFPYQSGYSGYNTYELPAGFNSEMGTALITHTHKDHFDSTLFAQCRLGLVAPHLPNEVNQRAITALSKQGIRITQVPTEHADMPHNSYLLEWEGHRLYFTGDTEDTTALLDASDLDAAFVTPWLIAAVNKAGREIDAKTVIMYHHEKDEFDGRTVNAPCTACQLRIPKQGEAIQLFQ